MDEVDAPCEGQETGYQLDTDIHAQSNQARDLPLCHKILVPSEEDDTINHSRSLSLSCTDTRACRHAHCGSIHSNKCTQMSRSNLHRALAGAGRGGGGGSGGSLGEQGLAAKLVGTVLSSWSGLFNSHLCCSGRRSLLIWTEMGTNTSYSHILSLCWHLHACKT